MQLRGFQPYSDGRTEAEFTSPKASKKRKTKGSGRMSTRKRTREETEEESEEENEEADDDGPCDTVRNSRWKGRSRSRSDEDGDEIVLSRQRGGVDRPGRGGKLGRGGAEDRNNNRSQSSPADRTADDLDVSNALGYSSDRGVLEDQADLCGAQATRNRFSSGADTDSPSERERVSTPASARLHSLNPNGDVGDRRYPTDELTLLFDRESPLKIRSKTDLFEEPSDVFLSGGAVRRRQPGRDRRKKKAVARNDDTDKEEGDEEDFTLLRRNRKAQRQANRRRGREEIPKLHTLKGNVEFVTMFDGHMNKKELSVKETQSSSLHRYSTVLFAGPNNWLGFMSGQAGAGSDFRLGQLIDWTSSDLRLVQGPEGWLESVPNELHLGTRK